MQHTRKALTAMLLAALFATPALAQEDYHNSYNYRMAEQYLSSGDYGNANAYIDSEIDQHPESACAYILKGDMYYGYELYDRAGIYYTTALMVAEGDKSQVEDYEMAVINYANLLVRALDKNDEAEAITDEAAKKAPTARLLVWQGWTAENNGHYDKAYKAYRAALKANQKANNGTYTPDDIYGGYIIPTLLKAGNLTEAEKVLAEAEKASPDGTAIKLAKVYLLDLQGKDEQAVDLCLETAFRNQSNGEALYSTREGGNWVDKLEDLAFKNYDLVIGKMEKFAKQKDASQGTLWLAARIANTLNRTRDFIRLWEEYTPDNFDSNPAVAIAYSEIFANNKAIEVFDKAIEKNPDERKIVTDKAQTLACLGDIDAAEALLNSVAAAEPDNARTYRIHANILLNYTTRYAEAAAYADSTVALSSTGLYSHMISNYRLGDTDKAEADADAIITYAEKAMAEPKAVKLSSLHKKYSSPTVPYAYAILGQKDKAIAALKKCLAPDVNLDYEPFYERYVSAAEVYSILGMADETLANLGKALEAGFRDFTRLGSSAFFDVVRGKQGYAELIDTYRAKYRQEIENLNN